jgi:hypothetical protein
LLCKEGGLFGSVFSRLSLSGINEKTQYPRF